jgi:tRNA U34 2-thiouridine synthase MnmA/TrmU
MAFSLKSKAGELLKDKIAVEVLEKYAPGITTNPLIKLAKQMTLEKLLSMPQAKQAGLTEEMLTKLLDEINERIK